jgi:hypothetical protein
MCSRNTKDKRGSVWKSPHESAFPSEKFYGSACQETGHLATPSAVASRESMIVILITTLHHLERSAVGNRPSNGRHGSSQPTSDPAPSFLPRDEKHIIRMTSSSQTQHFSAHVNLPSRYIDRSRHQHGKRDANAFQRHPFNQSITCFK